MWKQILCNKFILKPSNVRYFLSEAYKCSDAWENRLQSPILNKIRPDLFYYDLESKFQETGKICAVDLDILVNTVHDNTMLNELSDLVHKLRLTADTTHALASTSHAIIRHHLDFSDNDLENLIYILDDRLNYGIFLDSFTANLCLDKMIKLKNYRMAAKVATFLMLQENFDNAINRALSLYACFKYLDDPQPFDDLVKNQEDESILAAEIYAAMQEADPKAKKVKKRADRKEEVRVRINFIRNPFFDDHFDIRNSQHLVGKTFLAISRHMNDGPLKTSIELLGYCFYEKYSDGNKFLASLGNTGELHKVAVEIVKNKLAQIKDRDSDEHFKKFVAAVEQLSNSAKIKADSLENDINQLTLDTVKQHESSEIQEQIKIYELWDQIRERKLRDELERVDRHKRVDKIENMLEEMNEQEAKLWFFENETKIDLELEKITTVEVKTEKISRRQQKVIDDAYIPPEIKATRNK